MKSFYTLIFLFLIGIGYSQTQEVVIGKFSNDVCNCLNKLPMEKLESNPDAATTNCIQEGLDLNMDALLEVYGSSFLDGGELAHYISEALIEKLNENCEIYANLNKNEPLNNSGYNAKQLETIDFLTEWACNCSTEKLTANPNQSFQEVLETCMQNAVMENIEKLTDAFGNAILTDENVAYNIGVDVGNKLASECEVFISGVTTTTETHDNVKSTTGIIIDSYKKDYVSIVLLDNNNNENAFYVTTAFKGGKEFVDQLQELKKNETVITIFFVEEELYFKSDKTDKNVFRIETVDY